MALIAKFYVYFQLLLIFHFRTNKSIISRNLLFPAVSFQEGGRNLLVRLGTSRDSRWQLWRRHLSNLRGRAIGRDTAAIV